jgi:hypothetical protein
VGSEAGAFPVAIKNKFGTAEIKAAPKRVVVVGLVEQDALLALGVTPVATTEWFGDKPGALFPWAKAKLGDGAVPQVLNDKDGIQFETVRGTGLRRRLAGHHQDRRTGGRQGQGSRRTGQDDRGAVREGILSLPTVLDQLVPKLSEAVDGDPATT